MARMDDQASRFAVARNLLALMEERAWKQTDLAGRSGVGQSTISAILRREKAASVDTLDRIAAAFGLAAWQLLMPMLTNEPEATARVLELCQHFSVSSADGRALIAQVARRESGRT